MSCRWFLIVPRLMSLVRRAQVVEGCDAALQLDADKADILSLVQACLMPTLLR